MFRLESDSIGTKEVPASAYYGVQSLRAQENFKISGRKNRLEIVKGAVELKKASAKVNYEAGVLDKSIYQAISNACDDVLKSGYEENFIVDAFQGGAGTSLNMNVNEVITNRAIELLGGNKGDYSIVHPNDHVNLAQSTNDVYPTAGKIAIIRVICKAIDEIILLTNSFNKKANKYKNVIKMGRTEMQDAVPISFKQVFNSYKNVLLRDAKRFKLAISSLSTINMGATAIGTAINTTDYYLKNITKEVSIVTGIKFKKASDLVDGTQNLDCFAYVSGIIKTCACNLCKIANDLRLMSSGPRTGFGEINLPPKQNGSSIMPGKINPVILEAVNQISFKVMGNDLAVTNAVQNGQLELNAFEPLIFDCLLESLELLTNGIKTLRIECIDGITINEKRCNEEIQSSISIITALCPKIGYKKSAFLAKKALNENKTIKEVLLNENLFTEQEIDELLNPLNMIK